MGTKRLSAATAVLGAALVLGCSATSGRSTTVESGGDVAPSSTAVTPANNRTIPVGAMLTTTLDRELGTKVSKAGDMFTATVSKTLYASDGSIVVPAGTKIEGRVTAVDDSDNATEPSLIRLTFDRIRVHGALHPFAAAIVESSPVQTSDRSNAERNRQIIIGGAVGAALGGLIGGTDKIVIGGAIGAAVGSIVSLGTEVNATLPAGSQMTLRATQSTTLR